MSQQCRHLSFPPSKVSTVVRGWSNSLSTTRRVFIGVSALAVLIVQQVSALASCGDYLMPLGSHHGAHESMYPLGGAATSQGHPSQWDPNSFLSPYIPGDDSHNSHGYPSRSLCEGGRCQQAPAAPPIETWTSAAPRQFAVKYNEHEKNNLTSKSAWLFPTDSGQPEDPFLEVLSPPPRR